MPTMKSKYTALQGRKALLDACKKTKSGSKEVKLNGAVIHELLLLLEDLDPALTPPASTWVPVAELKGGGQYEWLHTLLPDGRVEPALWNDDSGQGEWCQWDEISFVPMPIQPTHYHPAPLAPKP